MNHSPCRICLKCSPFSSTQMWKHVNVWYHVSFVYAKAALAGGPQVTAVPGQRNTDREYRLIPNSVHTWEVINLSNPASARTAATRGTVRNAYDLDLSTNNYCKLQLQRDTDSKYSAAALNCYFTYNKNIRSIYPLAATPQHHFSTSKFNCKTWRLEYLCTCNE